MKTQYPLYLAGEQVMTDAVLEVVNPYTHEVFASASVADMQHLEIAIEKAEAVRQQLSAEPVYMRYERLMRIARLLSDKKEEAAQLLATESAKPLRYARGEIERAIQTFIVAAEESKRLPGEFMSLDWTVPGTGKKGIVSYVPAGIVAGISPFNFPLNLAVHKIAPAIAVGAPIILKPSSSTPLSTLFLADILHEAGVPTGAVSILPMSRSVGDALVTDPRFSVLSFTGSPAIGWDMKARSGKKKVVLELGGNAATIITPSSNIEMAIEKAFVSSFAYSGQVCIHTQRIYVHDSLFDTVVSAFTQKCKDMVIGDPLDADTEFSSMIDEKNAERIDLWVQESVSNGATLICGGERKGSLYMPTILTGTSPEDKVCAEEAFGPIVVIERYSQFEEAVSLVNAGKFGLQTGVFTDSHEEISYASQHLEVGGVIINDSPSFRVDHMPYGGVKDSGFGREGVKYAMLDMLEAKILVLPM